MGTGMDVTHACALTFGLAAVVCGGLACLGLIWRTRLIQILSTALLGIGLVFAFWCVYEASCGWPRVVGTACRAIVDSPPWTLLTSIGTAPALVLLWLWRTQAKDTELYLSAEQLKKKEQELKLTQDSAAQLGKDRQEELELTRNNAAASEAARREELNLSQSNAASAEAARREELDLARKNALAAEVARRDDQSRADREQRSRSFAEAVRLLTDKAVTARLGAICLLESLAVETPAECQHVISTLCAFVRRNGEAPPKEPDGSLVEGWSQPTDVQEALAAIGRIPRTTQRVDLRRAIIPRTELLNADLHDADLRGADLSGCNLAKVNFNDALLGASLMTGATLYMTDLVNARLDSADFRAAKLSIVDLTGAVLAQAKFVNAELRRVRLSGADVTGANFHQDSPVALELLSADFSGATFNGKTRIPREWGDPVKDLKMVVA